MNARAALRWLGQRFELARHGDAGNLPPMEGLRGVAVFMVFWVHFASLARPWAPAGATSAMLLDALERVGHAGVDLFFVLSGYLIYGSLIARARPFVPYMRRRVRRIYPAFLCVFGIYVLLAFAAPAATRLPQSGDALAVYLVANLLLLPGIFPIEPLINVAWSLSYEVFYYLCIPLLIGVFALRRRSVRVRCAFFVVIGLAGALYCALYTGPVRLVMFIGGILLWEALAMREPPTVNGVAVAAALLVALAVELLRPDGSWGYATRTLVFCAAFSLLCLRAFAPQSTRLSAALSWTPLRWLGNMSYSYYLVHGLTLKVLFTALALVVPAAPWSAPAFALLFVVAFAATLPTSALLFLAVERPLSLARAHAVTPRPVAA